MFRSKRANAQARSGRGKIPRRSRFGPRYVPLAGHAYAPRITKGRKTGGATDMSQATGQDLVYTAHVSLDHTSMQIENKLVSLVPGMAVTVEIKTGSRRVIEYLLSPLLMYKQEAMRER